VPELVNATGQIASAATLAWSQLDAHTAFNQILPARFEADSRAAALAEARFGAGRNLRSFLYLTIGTGIGASLVLDGAPYRGARGLTGTIASSAIEIECPRCHASVMLSVEDAASGSGLMRRFRERTGRQITTEQLLAAAEARSNATTDAVSVVLTGARALGAAVAAAVNMLDPEAVIVGGGLGLATGLYHNTFAAALRAHIWSDIHRDLPLLRAALGLDAGLVGAALSAAEFELARVPPPVSPPVSP
jgi:glucokinase